ncbi:MAG: hypothetical protein JWL69_1783 [Phycisphaerales bacterium]|nr:hypothetical protein [Phycisphaerales bacterium]
MGLRGVLILLCALAFFAVPVHAQYQPPSEKLVLTGKSAATWADGTTNIIQLTGRVTIELDRAKLSADGAVVWLSPVNPQNLEIQNAQIALIGNARLEQTQNHTTRSGGSLFVTTQVRGTGILIVADERIPKDQSNSDLYRQALALRQSQPPTTQPNVEPGRGPLVPRPPSTGPASRPTTGPARAQEVPIFFEARELDTTPRTEDGYLAAVLTGGVRLIDRKKKPDGTPNAAGDFLELSSQNAVLFTRVKSLREVQESNGKKRGDGLVVAAYLEGDVRAIFTPGRPGAPEQRLTADRIYYEFSTDRAVLTDAIVHTIEPRRGQPVVARAKLVRQLSQGEYSAEHMQLSTSTFALPSFSLAADRMYMRSEPSGDPAIGDRVVYEGRNTTLQAFDVPFFWLPYTAGDITERGTVLRSLNFGQVHQFGEVAETEWGLFETFGQVPPRDLDVNYRVDYFTERGPGFGMNASYGGGFLTDTSKQPWDFNGQFRSYFAYDKNSDDLGRLPVRVNDEQSLRGQVLWEHQHFFPDNWSAQFRAGWVSDGTFLEQWFRRDFEQGPPRDIMGYLKHQAGDEAFTFGATWQPMHLVTTSDFQQEQFEIDRLPEVGYYREGDSLADDHLTFFSENTGGGLHFATSRDSLVDQGFLPPIISPGLPAEGYTGITGKVVWRGDFRQEADFPVTTGPVRVVPYVMGRFTQYSDTPQGNARSRLLAGAGTRITTEFWKIDPTVESNLFDIHQLRHVVEPEINLFTSAMNAARDQVFVFDPNIDAINDVSAAQFALHQRWQTKRGGPGQWRNVDAFTLNVDVEYYNNKPPKAFREPTNFRGLFFASAPEESVPRDAINADASWRLSDNTVLLGDMAYNLDKSELQLFGIGVLVQRDVRFSYFIGNRYLADLNANLTTVHADYQIGPKYVLDIDQEFDFTQGKNVYSSVALARQFDTFFLTFRYFFDETTRQNGVSFNIAPIGLGRQLDTGSLSAFHR